MLAVGAFYQQQIGNGQRDDFGTLCFLSIWNDSNPPVPMGTLEVGDTKFCDKAWFWWHVSQQNQNLSESAQLQKSGLLSLPGHSWKRPQSRPGSNFVPAWTIKLGCAPYVVWDFGSSSSLTTLCSDNESTIVFKAATQRALARQLSQLIQPDPKRLFLSTCSVALLRCGIYRFVSESQPRA